MKKEKYISSYYDNESKTPELMTREAFLRAAKELLDSFGIDKYSAERLQGMVALVEKFDQLNPEK